MEHDNFRDALAWLVSDGPAEEAGRLAEALAWYWMMGGYITEARHWLSLVNGLAEVSDAVRSRTLYQAASILLRVGELEVATGVFEEALTLARRLGDPDATVRILDWLGDTRQELGDFARAKECIDEALALARGRRSQQLIATVLHASALLALRQGDLGRAEDLVDEACMLWQELGEAIGLANSLRLAGITLADQEEYERATAALDRSLAILRQGAESWASSLALMWRGIVAEAQGDLEHAGEWYQEALDLEATGEDRRMRALASMRLAGFQCRLGDYEQARSLYATSVALMQTLGFLHPDLGDVVYGLAEYAAAVGRPAEAARLLGAAEVRLATLGIHLAPRQASWIAHIGAAIGEQLDTDAFEQALEEGRDTPLGELLDAALRLRPAHIGLHLAAENGDAGAVPSP
jgi:tetratricopeptide (TPR) repeat protein